MLITNFTSHELGLPVEKAGGVRHEARDLNRPIGKRDQRRTKSEAFRPEVVVTVDKNTEIMCFSKIKFIF